MTHGGGGAGLAALPHDTRGGGAGLAALPHDPRGGEEEQG